MSKLALVFITAFLYGSYAVLTKGPAFGFYMYEVVYFLNPKTRWWYSSVPVLSYPFIISVLMLTSFFIYKSRLTLNTYSKFPGGHWFALLFISFLLAYFWAANQSYHLPALIELSKTYLIIYIAYRIIDSESKLQWALICFSIGAAYIGFEAHNVGRDAQGRVEGIGLVDSPGANTTAAAILPAIPILLYFAWRVEWKYKLLIGVLAALIANGLILINSRGALIGTATGVLYFLFYMVFSRYKLPKQRLIVSLMLIGLVGATVRLTDDTFWDRMATLKEQTSTESEGSGGKRMNYWLATFDMLEDFPLGVGINGYQALSPIYLTDEDFFDDVTAINGVKHRAVHSLWFQGLSEVGWHGMTFFFLLLISLKRSLSKAKKILILHRDYELYYLAIALEAAMLSFLLTSSFIDQFRVQVLYWLILYCACFSAIVTNKYSAETLAKGS